MSSFYSEIYKLKNILRKGWLLWGASDASTGRVESDAEHTLSMALLAMEIMAKKKLDLDELKVYKMILIHELCEIDPGDHTPYDGITPSEKQRLEDECIKRIAEEHDMPEILELWTEFKEYSTPEAIFVKKLDKVDTVAQSKIYADQIKNEDLFNEFYINHKEKVSGFDEFIDSI